MNSLVLGLALVSPAHPPHHLPPPPPVFVPAPAVLTVAQFAKVFHPTPGHHTVWLHHPRTCQPVKVCFNLPPGCPKVRVSPNELEFDYGRLEVEIQFRRNGTVDVEYDD